MDLCTEQHDGLSITAEVLQTSAAGDRLAQKAPGHFIHGEAEGLVVRVAPDEQRQQLHGIGSSFTEAAAFVLATLPREQRDGLMREIWGEDGANLSMARTVIGATDFSVEGRFSYCDTPGDTRLESFSIDVDRDGFSRQRYPQIEDESFDLLPMIQQALAIKQQQQDELKIVASAWTAPAWMKDNEDWYTAAADGRAGYGGALKPEHVKTYADYLLRYLDAYAAEGIDIWAITPVNEPHGNHGQWESMHFSPETQRAFIRDHLGPALRSSVHDTRLLIYDQNRSDLARWADSMLSDPSTSQYIDGCAVHWYDSTYKVYGEVFDRLHNIYPRCEIIQTEGCIDDLGNEAPPGVHDPERYREQDWFGNDDFWWHDNATDWAYSADWHGVITGDHPIYTPVHRYARDIIGCMNHWVSGWIDWNVVLDARGGPNHVGNYCGAPVMIDTASGEIYRTPLFHVLSQFSRCVRPGDHAVTVKLGGHEACGDTLVASANLDGQGMLSVHVLNMAAEARDFCLQVADRYCPLRIDANALQSVRLQL